MNAQSKGNLVAKSSRQEKLSNINMTCANLALMLTLLQQTHFSLVSGQLLSKTYPTF